MVYAQQQREGGQVVCKQGVFPHRRGASENSLAVVGNALIVENNFGYSGPKNIPRSEPGLARVNILADGKACEVAWENLEITSPSAVPKVSLANGLVYVYTRDESNPDDLHAWYFTALDVQTGEVVYKQLTGIGWFFNNHYGAITLGQDGAAYVGIMGGLVKLRDRAPQHHSCASRDAFLKLFFCYFQHVSPPHRESQYTFPQIHVSDQ